MLSARFYAETVTREDGTEYDREVIEITTPNGNKSVHLPTVQDLQTYDHAYAAFKNPGPTPPSHDEFLAEWREKNPGGVMPSASDMAAESERVAMAARDKARQQAVQAARTVAVPEVVGPGKPMTPHEEIRRNALAGQATRTPDEEAELARLNAQPTVSGGVGAVTNAGTLGGSVAEGSARAAVGSVTAPGSSSVAGGGSKASGDPAGGPAGEMAPGRATTPTVSDRSKKD